MFCSGGTHSFTSVRGPEAESSAWARGVKNFHKNLMPDCFPSFPLSAGRSNSSKSKTGPDSSGGGPNPSNSRRRGSRDREYSRETLLPPCKRSLASLKNPSRLISILRTGPSLSRTTRASETEKKARRLSKDGDGCRTRYFLRIGESFFQAETNCSLTKSRSRAFSFRACAKWLRVEVRSCSRL